MPAAIPALGAAATFFTATTAGKIIAGVGAGVLGFAVQKFFGEDYSYEDHQRGIDANVTNSVEPIPICYGTYRYAGSAIYRNTNPNDIEQLWQVIAFAEGEIDSFVNIYIDDILYTDARYNSRNGPNVGVETHVGTDTQAASSALTTWFPGVWTSAHQLKGVAYIVIWKYIIAGVYGGIPIISAEVKGKKVWDVVSSTTAWSNNPANCIYDYLTNTRYGRGIAAADIDLTSFQAAHAICAGLVSNPPEPSQARYTCDGLVNIDNDPLENIKDLLTCCRGSLVYSGGKYKLLIDQAESTSASYTETQLVGPLTINPGGRSDRFNSVKVRYYNDNKKYQQDFVTYSNATHQTEDNGALLEKEILLKYTTDEYRARRIAQVEEEQSRNTVTVSFKTDLTGLRSEVGDVISLTHSTPGWTNKLFKVHRIRVNSAEEIELTAQEYDGTSYTPDTPPAIVAPPSYTPPEGYPIERDVVNPSTTHIIGFEDSMTSDWDEDDGTIDITDTSYVGNYAAEIHHGGGGAVASVSYDVPDTFAANILIVADNQIRVQFWARSAPTGGSTGMSVRLSGSSELQAWQNFTLTSSYQSFGFLWKPTAAQTSLDLQILADVPAGTNSNAILIDNIVLFKVPDLINTGNIGTWIGSAAIGSAYIANAAITNAKIATAAVDTLEIAGNAVTVPGYSTANVGAACLVTPTWFDTGASVSLTGVAARQAVTIIASANESECTNQCNGLDKMINMRLVKGTSTVLVTEDISTGGNYNSSVIVYNDIAPGTGALTYKIQVQHGQGSFPTGTGNKYRLLVMDTKR